MITASPGKISEEAAALFAILRATPLGGSLERDDATWNLEDARATSYAAHFTLSCGQAEVRVAVARGVVVEEDWYVRPVDDRADAEAIARRMGELKSALDRPRDALAEMRGALPDASAEEKAQPAWAASLDPALARLQGEMTSVTKLLRTASKFVRDELDRLDAREEESRR